MEAERSIEIEICVYLVYTSYVTKLVGNVYNCDFLLEFSIVY